MPNFDARRGSLHSSEPGHPTLSMPGLMVQLKMDISDPVWIGKLDLYRFYYRLDLPTHL